MRSDGSAAAAAAPSGPGMDSGASYDVDAIMAQLRSLASSALSQHLPETAAWYADKLLSLGQGANRDDVHLLAKAYLQAGDPERALHQLDRHGLSDPAKLANPARPRPPLHSGVGPNYVSLVKDPRIPVPPINRASDGGLVDPAAVQYIYTAALCLKATKQWDRCAQLFALPQRGVNADTVSGHRRYFQRDDVNIAYWLHCGEAVYLRMLSSIGWNPCPSLLPLSQLPEPTGGLHGGKGLPRPGGAAGPRPG